MLQSAVTPENKEAPPPHSGCSSCTGNVCSQRQCCRPCIASAMHRLVTALRGRRRTGQPAAHEFPHRWTKLARGNLFLLSLSLLTASFPLILWSRSARAPFPRLPNLLFQKVQTHFCVLLKRKSKCRRTDVHYYIFARRIVSKSFCVPKGTLSLKHFKCAIPLHFYFNLFSTFSQHHLQHANVDLPSSESL